MVKKLTGTNMKTKEQISEYNKAWKNAKYKNNPNYREIVLKKRRDSYNSYRTQIFTLVGEVCAYCGFKDKRALQIDHIDNSGFKHRKETIGATYYKKILEEILNNKNHNYQTLCANCNWIKKYKN